MKRFAMLALVLDLRNLLRRLADQSVGSERGAGLLPCSLPSNEVPAVTNADAGASGTMQLTMTVTRDAANIITGATYDFVVNYHRVPGEHHADGRPHS